ncbi:MAG: UDP-glucose 6-dehydrogenase, partial [Algisphaera sp.]
MNISIFGLGYVGAVTSACLAKTHNIIGVDPDPYKLSLIRAGKSPIIEEGLDELVSRMVKLGRIVATEHAQEAVLRSDLSIVCVGTP